MTEKDNKFDLLLRKYRMLTPEQQAWLTRQVIAEAKAWRAKAIRDLFRRLLHWIGLPAVWVRQRAAVARLQRFDDRMLQDIGIYRGEIEAAVRDPEWRSGTAPPTESSVRALTPGRACKRESLQSPRDHADRAA